MDFEWNEDKRAANIERHGVDFLSAALLFDGRPVVSVLSPFESEERYLTVGFIEDRFVTVVWTWRENAVRIISARRTRDSEKAAYHARFAV
jgi:uncharacterized protein